MAEDLFGINAINELVADPTFQAAEPERRAAVVTRWENEVSDKVRRYGKPEEVETLAPLIADKAERERAAALGTDDHGKETLGQLNELKSNYALRAQEDTSPETQASLTGQFQEDRARLLGEQYVKRKVAESQGYTEGLKAAGQEYNTAFNDLANKGTLLPSTGKFDAVSEPVGLAAKGLFAVPGAIATGDQSMLQGIGRSDARATEVMKGFINGDPASTAIVQRYTGLKEATPAIKDTWSMDFGKNGLTSSVLSNGNVLVNPSLAFKPKEWDAAVDATAADPKAKAAAKQARLQVRDAVAPDTVDAFFQLPSFREFYDSQPATQGFGETIEKYNALPHKDDTAAKLMLNLESNIANVSSQLYGVGGLLGSKGATQLAQFSSEKGQEYQAGIAAGGGVPYYAKPAEWGTDLFFSLAPSLASAGLTKFAGFLGKSAGVLENGISEAGQMRSVVGAAGLQSAGGNFSDFYRTFKQQGFSDDEAARKARVPALLTGAVTAGLTALMPEGAEQAMVGHPVKAGLLKGIAGAGIHEFAEESADQLGSGLIEAAMVNPDLPFSELLKQSGQAGLMGFAGAGLLHAANQFDQRKMTRIAADLGMTAQLARDAKARNLPETQKALEETAKVKLAALVELLGKSQADDFTGYSQTAEGNVEEVQKKFEEEKAAAPEETPVAPEPVAPLVTPEPAAPVIEPEPVAPVTPPVSEPVIVPELKVEPPAALPAPKVETPVLPPPSEPAPKPIKVTPSPAPVAASPTGIIPGEVYRHTNPKLTGTMTAVATEEAPPFPGAVKVRHESGNESWIGSKVLTPVNLAATPAPEPKVEPTTVTDRKVETPAPKPKKVAPAPAPKIEPAEEPRIHIGNAAVKPTKSSTKAVIDNAVSGLESELKIASRSKTADKANKAKTDLKSDKVSKSAMEKFRAAAASIFAIYGESDHQLATRVIQDVAVEAIQNIREHGTPFLSTRTKDGPKLKKGEVGSWNPGKRMLQLVEHENTRSARTEPLLENGEPSSTPQLTPERLEEPSKDNEPTATSPEEIDAREKRLAREADERAKDTEDMRSALEDDLAASAAKLAKEFGVSLEDSEAAARKVYQDFLTQIAKAKDIPLRSIPKLTERKRPTSVASNLANEPKFRSAILADVATRLRATLATKRSTGNTTQTSTGEPRAGLARDAGRTGSANSGDIVSSADLSSMRESRVVKNAAQLAAADPASAGQYLNALPEELKQAKKSVEDAIPLGKNLDTVLKSIAETTDDPMIRALAQAMRTNPRLKEVATKSDWTLTGKNRLGQWDGSTVSVNPLIDPKRATQTVLHEAAHAITLAAIAEYDYDPNLLPPAVREAVADLHKLRLEAVSKTKMDHGFADVLNGSKSFKDWMLSVPADQRMTYRQLYYGLTSTAEFVSEVMTNKDFQSHLAGLKANSEVKKTGLWNRVKAALRTIWFNGTKVNEGSILAKAFDRAVDLSAHGYNGETGVADVASEGKTPEIMPPVKDGYTRLYRAETSDTPTPIPDWIKDTDEYKATVDATGRWFSDTKENADFYKKTFGNGSISYVDIPTADIEKYRASNLPEGKFSAAGRSKEEFFLPKELASGRKPVFESADVRMDGEIEGLNATQFTVTKEGPSKNATFVVRGEVTPEKLVAKLAEVEDRFSVASEDAPVTRTSKALDRIKQAIDVNSKEDVLSQYVPEGSLEGRIDNARAWLESVDPKLADSKLINGEGDLTPREREIASIILAKSFGDAAKTETDPEEKARLIDQRNELVNDQAMKASEAGKELANVKALYSAFGIDATPETAVRDTYTGPSTKQQEKELPEKDKATARKVVQRTRKAAAQATGNRLTEAFLKLYPEQEQLVFDFFEAAKGNDPAKLEKARLALEAAVTSSVIDSIRTAAQATPEEARLVTDEVAAQVKEQVNALIADKDDTKLTRSEQAEKAVRKIGEWFGGSNEAASLFTKVRDSLVSRAGVADPALRPLIERLRDATYDPVNAKGLAGAIRKLIPIKAMLIASLGERSTRINDVVNKVRAAFPSITDEQVPALEQAIRSVFAAELAKAAKASVDALTKEKAPGIGKWDESATTSLIRYMNSGALDNEAAYNALAEKFNLPTWNPDTVAWMKEEFAKIQELPEGLPRNVAEQKMLTELAKRHWQENGASGKWGHFRDVTNALWVSGALSSPVTQAVNAGWTAFNTFTELAWLAYARHKQALAAGSTKDEAAKFFSDIFRTFKHAIGTGAVTDGSNFKTGSQAWLEFESALTTGSTRFSAETKEALGVLEQYELQPPPNNLKEFIPWLGKSYLALNKFVGRLMLASDAFNRAVARSGSEIMATRYDHLMRKAGGEDINVSQEMDKIFDPSGDVTTAIRKQIQDEGFTGSDAQRRYHELLEKQLFPEQTRREAEDFAAKASFNNSPEGAIGWAFMKIFGTLTKIPLFGRVPVSFPKTLANMINLSLDYTPYGFARMKNKRFSNLLQSGTLDGYAPKKIDSGSVEHHQQFARAAAGSTLMGMLALAIFGLNKDKDDKFVDVYAAGPLDANQKRQVRESNGERRQNTLKIGGTNIAYSDIPGIGMWIGALGAIRDFQRYDKRWQELTPDQQESLVKPILLRTVSAVLDRNMLSGSRDLVTALTGKEYEADAALWKLLSSASDGVTHPQVFRWLSATLASKEDTRELESTMNGWLLNRVPVLPDLYGRPAYNVLGETIHDDWWNPTTKRFGALPSKENAHPILNALTKAGLFVPVATQEADLPDGTKIRRNDPAFYDYSRAYAETVGKIVTPEFVQTLTALPKDVAQKVLTSQVGAAARQVATAKVFELRQKK